MIKLIVNADDFGYSRGVNYGIIDAHKYGIVNSTTMMMNMPDADHAIELAKQTPSLPLGIHLVLTCGRPLLPDVPTLVNQDGNFKKLGSLKDNRDLLSSEIEREWTAQIEKFLATGLVPTHFDSHHHVHTLPELLPIVQRLSAKYQLPVRRINEMAVKGVPAFTDVFLHDFYGDGATWDYFNNLGSRADENQVVEVMCHPGYLDFSLMTGSSYNKERVRETAILTSVKLPNQVTLYK
ncbi:chitin disaccharide deacetylase [Neobacillus dielmonensis]|uniref:chitin disaccharide deacetylase n=1 Tax=Neobacillus dielmonensis TaxID=1347369 RepID=UPI0005AA1B5F|nr:chitin disaccharide deacetylase [Neobacillus dielmonensis]